jgi:alkanesulfonate monooxygenase SsuD/methylene tetrahydromethanopterin reductase-like flavin-dependent oxidoreductase (luciferase family)
MDRGVALLRAAWATAAGEPGEDGTPDYGQAPAGKPVPIWFGGSSAAARRRAAAVGDGWIPLFLTPPEYEDSLAALRRETEDAGRDPGAVEPGIVVFACVGDDGEAQARGAAWLSRLYHLPAKSFRRHLVAGSPDACAAALLRFAEAGARHIAVMVAGAPAVDQFAHLRGAFSGGAVGAEDAGAGRRLAEVPA